MRSEPDTDSDLQLEAEMDEVIDRLKTRKPNGRPEPGSGHRAFLELARDMPPRYSKKLARFGTFKAETEEQKKALYRVHGYIGPLGEMVAAGRGLILFGSVGT